MKSTTRRIAALWMSALSIAALCGASSVSAEPGEELAARSGTGAEPLTRSAVGDHDPVPPREAAPSPDRAAAAPAEPAEDPRSGLGWIGGFERYVLLDPGKICALVADAGDVSAWGPSPIMRGMFECSALETLSQDADVGRDDVRLFTMVRGPSEGFVSLLRFKISASNEDGAERGAAVAVERITEVFDAMQWAMPTTALRDIEALETVDQTIAGTRILFGRERRSEAYYNLILQFPDSTRLLYGDVANAFTLDWDALKPKAR